MLNKVIYSNSAAKKQILDGIDLLADAVKITLGPKGRCVVIAEPEKPSKVTKDGVTVAKSIKLDDLALDAGAQLIKEASIKTLASVGDATTTSTVLAQAMCHGIWDALDKHNPVLIKKGIEQAMETARTLIKEKFVIPINSNNDIARIATISANNDPIIGTLIGNAFKKVGKDGIITVQESVNSETTVKVVKGMQFDRGYIAPHFVTDVVKDVCELDNPYIIITEQPVNRMKDIAFILNQIAQEHKSLLIIAEDYDPAVLETLKLNKLRGTISVCCIKAPSFKEYRKQILDDIAILTNGTHISYESALTLGDLRIDYLGTCDKVLVTKDSTTIIGGNGDVSARVEELKNTLERSKQEVAINSEFLNKFYAERIAKLTSGIATIYVGGYTEAELYERKDRIDDAVSATKAAVEMGVVRGGGITYLSLARELTEAFKGFSGDSDTLTGIKIFIEALKVPFKTIVENAGADVNKAYTVVDDTIGYDASTGLFVDMYKTGIIDPAKAVLLALENATSVACMFAISDCLIVPAINQSVYK